MPVTAHRKWIIVFTIISSKPIRETSDRVSVLVQQKRNYKIAKATQMKLVDVITLPL